VQLHGHLDLKQKITNLCWRAKKEKKMILKQEQTRKLREVEDRWLNNFDKMDFDENKARAFVKEIYKFAGFPEPKIIIFNGPNSMKETFRDYILDKEHSTPYNDYIENIVKYTDGLKIFSSGYSFTKLFSLELGKEVYQKLTKDEFFYYSNYLVKLLDKLRYKIGNDMKDVFKEVIICDYFNEIGLIKKKETILRFLKIKELLTCNIYGMICMKEICYITKPPLFIKLDNNSEPHSAEGPAIYFEDKTSHFFVHGIEFLDREYYDYVFGKNASGRKILSMRNLEKKAALVKLYGYERILKDIVELRTLDKYEKTSQITGKKTTCELLEFDLDYNMLRVIKVEDHSVHKITFIGVPMLRQTRTCIGALAWTFGLKTKEYKPLLES
jgi:hypothetical protein